MVIERANEEDAVEILALQKLAFESQAKLYDDYTLPPMTQTVEELRQDFRRQDFLKAVVHGKIIGSVRAHMVGDMCYVERLVVHPEYQDRGIGTVLMTEIEALFSGAARYRLFTGHRSEKSLHLYRKMGYRMTGEERIREGLTLIHMEAKRNGDK